MAVAFGGSFRGGNVPPVISTSPALQIKKNVIFGSFLNRLFHSGVLSYLAYGCKRGWGWPCFDTELSAFVIQMPYYTNNFDLQSKSKKVFINTRSPAASQIFNGLVSVKWSVESRMTKEVKRKFLKTAANPHTKKTVKEGSKRNCINSTF